MKKTETCFHGYDVEITPRPEWKNKVDNLIDECGKKVFNVLAGKTMKPINPFFYYGKAVNAIYNLIKK